VASGRAFKQVGMWVVTCCCCVAVVVPVLRGGAPDPGAVGILGIIAGFLFTSTKPADAAAPRAEREHEEGAA
jgi:hypothetical protein